MKTQNIARGESLTGKSFGRWLVGDEVVTGKYSKAYRCSCTCGGSKLVNRYQLTSGASKSCGCLKSELTTARSTKHGGTGHDLWRTYTSMKNRCNNPKYSEYHLYGGRGIKVCQRWEESFANFLEDMGDRPSKDHQLDRKDNELGYCKDNCRWVTALEQVQNRRNTVWVERHGVRMTLKAAAESAGLDYHAVFYRYQKGDRDERLFRPSQATA